jgi:hypothetical protein
MAGITAPPAIVVLGRSALATARRIQAACPGSLIHGLETRVEGETDCRYAQLSDHLRALYAQGTPIVALCAAGIVIRCIAPMLANKGIEPPVLAVAEDGSAVVPLLGGLAGVNVLAREIARALSVAPAITTSGELRFGTCLLNPPDGYLLADLEQGKHFVSDLLSGESARIEGDAPWLEQAQIPQGEAARLTIRVTTNSSFIRAASWRRFPNKGRSLPRLFFRHCARTVSHHNRWPHCSRRLLGWETRRPKPQRGISACRCVSLPALRQMRMPCDASPHRSLKATKSEQRVSTGSPLASLMGQSPSTNSVAREDA